MTGAVDTSTETMKKLRGEERWCQAILSAVLHARVEQHDDGSRPSMHDLDIYYSDGRQAAAEVTAAADADAIEFWNLINGNDELWIEPDLKGGWTVSVGPTARANRLRKELPSLLHMLEDLAVGELRTDYEDRPVNSLGSLARDLGIAYARQGETCFRGSIYILPKLTFEQSGGMVDNGDPLAGWIGDFLAAPAQNDVRDKLASSGADERHAFILMPGFTPAPFTVAYLLMEDSAPLPVKAPTLPEEVTHVWAMSTWNSGHVVSWSPASGWTCSMKLTSIQYANGSDPRIVRACDGVAPTLPRT